MAKLFAPVPLDVFGWEFRNEENTTGANDRSFYVPQKERDFNFLFNRKDFEAVWHASRCDEWRMPDDCALATQTPAGSNVFIPRSRAHFTITEIELGNLIPHSHAWIENMDFKVDVYLPAE
jgi:hypothetical protein